MPTLLDGLPFLVLALLGSVHCMGMCGPLVLAMGLRGRTEAISHGVGKALAYGVLGIGLASGLTLLVGRGAAPGTLETVRRGLSWVAGGVLVAMGVAALASHFGVGLGGFSFGERLVRPLRRVLHGLRGLAGWSGPFALGFVNGLLPCGLSWAAMIQASSLSPLSAGFGMVVFGLGTVPALWSVLLLGGRIPAGARARLRWALAPGLVILGVLTAARAGLPWESDAVNAVLPECCQPVDGSGLLTDGDGALPESGPAAGH